MLQGTRRRLDKLLGRRTTFPPPTPPADTAAAETLRESLVRWQGEATERFGRLFLNSKPLLALKRERALFETLRQLGLVARLGPSIYQACVRLFPLYGRFIATDLLSHRDPDQVFSLMFEQVYLVRNMDIEEGDHVLELCLGSGVNSLFGADVAHSVTAVDLNARALAFARFNEALSPAACPLHMFEGSLFEPLPEDEAYDVILVNPPFELVPAEEGWFLHSDGGEDGLDVVRAILEEAPERLADGGRFQIITWSPGTAEGPLLVDLMRRAFPRCRLTVHVLDVAPLDRYVEPFANSPHYAAWRARLDARHLSDVYFLYVHAAPAATPGVEVITPEAEVAICDALTESW